MNPAWQILPDPITADVFSASQSTAQTGRSIGTGVAGRGVLLPFRRDQNTDFASGAGAELTRSAVGLVLGTVCGSDSSHGELPWRTEFGSLLHLLRLRNNSPALAELARYYIAAALTRWIPSVRLRSVLVTTYDTSLTISIRYDVVDPVGAKVLVPGLETSVPVG